jgi:hypothetical protein
LIVERFGIDVTLPFNIQYFEQEWNDYVDVENFDSLPDKSKLRCIFITRPEIVPSSFQPTDTNTSVSDEHSRSDVTLNVSAVSMKDISVWPSPFPFPVGKLPCAVHDALNNKVNLLNPKQRYYRGQLVTALCHEALSIKSHPNNSEKIDMAKSIICTWPHLKEPVGRGFDGWLSSIVEGLKAARRELGLVDTIRSAAVRKRKLQISYPPSVETVVGTCSFNNGHEQLCNSSDSGSGAACLMDKGTSAAVNVRKSTDNGSGSKRLKWYNKNKKTVEHSASCTDQTVVSRPKASGAVATAEHQHGVSCVDSISPDIVCQPPVTVDVNNNCFADWHLYDSLPMVCQPAVDASLTHNIPQVKSNSLMDIETLNQPISVATSLAAAWCALSQTDHLNLETWNKSSLSHHPDSLSSVNLTKPAHMCHSDLGLINTKSGTNSELQAELASQLVEVNSLAAPCEDTFSLATAGNSSLVVTDYLQANQESSCFSSAGQLPTSCISSHVVLSSNISSVTSAGSLPLAVIDMMEVSPGFASCPAAAQSVVVDGLHSSISKVPDEMLAQSVVMTGASRHETLKENSFSQHVIDEMQREWNLPVKDRNMKKLLHLLQVSYEDRRKLVYNHATTAAVRKTYPALFCQDAIQQEYERVSGCCSTLKMTRKNIIEKASRLLKAAERLTVGKGCNNRPTLTNKSYRNSSKINVIESVLQKLNLAVEHCDDLEKHQFMKATAGLVLLPWLLGEKAEYFCKVYEVNIM